MCLLQVFSQFRQKTDVIYATDFQPSIPVRHRLSVFRVVARVAIVVFRATVVVLLALTDRDEPTVQTASTKNWYAKFEKDLVNKAIGFMVSTDEPIFSRAGPREPLCRIALEWLSWGICYCS